jgi:hypothetical protein
VGIAGTRLPLDAVEGFAEATPSPKLCELIRDLGVPQPVVVAATRSGCYEILEGRRRCKAIAQLTGEGEWPAPPHVEALIVDPAKPVRQFTLFLRSKSIQHTGYEGAVRGQAGHGAPGPV